MVLLTKILPAAEKSPYKSEHRDPTYVGCCTSSYAIVYCYQTLCLVQKWDNMYWDKEPEKFEAIPIDWFKLNNRLCQLF